MKTGDGENIDTAGPPSGNNGINSAWLDNSTRVLTGKGLGFTFSDVTGNLSADPINLQSIVIAAAGSTASDLATPTGRNAISKHTAIA